MSLVLMLELSLVLCLCFLKKFVQFLDFPFELDILT
jgi:hypothetical protein